MIHVNDISKVYHLYDSPTDRLKEALSPFRKSYHKDFYALKNIGLHIKDGESVGIIGMNGSGKSTLLKIITGVLTPTTGSIQVNGKISALLELGSGFNPEFTGIENAHFQCSLQGFDKKQTDALMPEILRFADIGSFIHQPVKTYSSGMYVRLAFAVAINVNPDILVVDEALAVGDAYFQSKCIDKIKEFKRQNKTLLFVSHDPGAVKTLCDRAFLLHQGKLVDQGDPDKVYDYYNALLAEKDAHEKGQAPNQAHLRERSGNRKMEITKVEIENARGQVTETFVSGEEVAIAIEATAHSDVENPTFGILIRDRLGNDIFGINNYSMEMSVGKIARGEKIRVRYKLPLNLGPNIYNLTVAAHSDHTHVQDSYDWINNAVVFRAVPSTDLQFIGACRIRPRFSFESV